MMYLDNGRKCFVDFDAKSNSECLHRTILQYYNAMIAFEIINCLELFLVLNKKQELHYSKSCLLSKFKLSEYPRNVS